MAINPHRKGGPDVPVVDGGTGASDGASALSNLGGLDVTSHGSVNHSGILGVGDLTTVAHGSLDHTGIPFVGVLRQVKYYSSNTLRNLLSSVPPDNTIPQIGETQSIISGAITPLKATSTILVFAQTTMTAANVNDSFWCFFLNGGSNAERVQTQHHPAVGVSTSLCLIHAHTAGNTVPQTWDFRGAFRTDLFFGGSAPTLNAAHTLGGRIGHQLILAEVQLTP